MTRASALLILALIPEGVIVSPADRGIPSNVIVSPSREASGGIAYSPSFPNGDVTFETSLVAFWNLDETSGNRVNSSGSCGSDCDLSPVNTPLYRGAAKTYGAKFVDADDAYFKITNSAELRMTTNHWSAIVWQTVAGGASYPPLISYSAATNYLIMDFNVATRKARTVCGGAIETAAAYYTVNVPAMQAGGYDGTNIWASGNGATRTQAAGGPCNAPLTNFYLGSRGDALTVNPTGTIGLVAFWKDRDLLDAELLALYNSGKGIPCAEMTTAQKVGLLACWDNPPAAGNPWPESGVGSCGANCTFSPINSVNQTANLNHTTAMGGSAYAISTSSHALNVSDNAYLSVGDEDFTWGCYALSSSLGNKILVDKADEYQIGLDGSNKFYMKTGTTDTATWGSAASADTWYFVAGGHRKGTDTWVSVNAGTRVTTTQTVAPADTENQLRIFSTSAAANFWDGAAAQCGFWKRDLTDDELTTLSSATEKQVASLEATVPDMAYWLAWGDSKTSSGKYQLTVDAALYRTATDTVAVSGETLAQMKAHVDTDLASESRQANTTRALVNIGANDVAAGLPAQATWEANLAYVLDAFRAKWSNIKVYVMRIWRRGYNTESDTLAGWISNVLATRSTWAFVGPDERVFLQGEDDGESETIDGVHPTNAYYAITGTLWMYVLGF